MIKSVTLSVPPLRVISPLKNKSFSSLFAPFLAIPRLCNFAVHLKHILLRYLLPLASPDSDIGFGMFSSVSIYTFEICTGSSRLANDRILHLCLHFYCYIFQYFPQCYYTLFFPLVNYMCANGNTKFSPIFHEHGLTIYVFLFKII